MASTYTTSGIELIADGEQAGTWGQTTNTNWEMMEEMVGGVVAVALSSTTYTLTTSDGVSSEGRHAVVKFTGSPGGTCTVTISPNDVQKTYWIVNGSDQTVTLTQGSGGNVSVAAGYKAVVYCDGAGAGAEVVDLTADLTVTGNKNWADNEKANFGDSQDLQIYHDGSNSHITDAGTGNLKIAGSQIDILGGADGAETMATFVDDGAVTLYYDNSAKIATTNTGATVTGTVVADGLTLGDNDLAQFGDSQDLQIYHDGSNSYIKDNGTGNIIMDSATVEFTGNAVFGDNDKAIFGDGSDLEIYHDGSNSYINDVGTGNLYVQADNYIRLRSTAGEYYAECTNNGGVSLYYDNNAKFATASTGANVTGTITATVGGEVDFTTDNDGSFDLGAGQNFTCTPTGNITLTFTNIPNGKSGFILLVNTGGHTVSLHANSKADANFATTVSTTGTYVVSYITNGTNAYLTTSGAIA